MRRIILPLAAAAATALGACSGGGSVLGTGGSPDRVIITVAAPANVARVLAGSSIPLSATAVRGSQNGVVGAGTVRWDAAIVNGAVYATNTVGGTKACAAVTNGTAAAGPFAPYAPDYSTYLTIDPTNESNVIFTPPLVIPNPGTFPGPLSATNAYCVAVNATVGGTTGSLVVAVVNPQSPQQ